MTRPAVPLSAITIVSWEPLSPLRQVSPACRDEELGTQRGSVTVKVTLLTSPGVFLLGACFKPEVAFIQRGEGEQVNLALPLVGGYLPLSQRPHHGGLGHIHKAVLLFTRYISLNELGSLFIEINVF